MKQLFFIFFFLKTCLLTAVSPDKIHIQYNSLDPKSIYQHLAFYQLYPNSPEGQQALKNSWQLLSANPMESPPKNHLIPLADAVSDLVNLFCGGQTDQSHPPDPDSITFMRQAGNQLSNRQLRGYYASSEEEILALPPNEIDLAHALLLSQEAGQIHQQEAYEATLDLLALEVLSHIGYNATDKEKIAALNHLIFDQLGIRFPPQSVFSEQIDGYTFLPTVLDSRRGVCLGVSILYLCLAQRVDLPLEIITPPGHIYLRYKKNGEEINIETTARGINTDSERYLNINTRSLQMRNIKEVIGLAHINEGAAFWQQNNYKKTLSCYEKAFPYLPDDCLLKELAAYNYLFIGNITKGTALLNEIKDHIPDYAVSKKNIAQDYLDGRVNIEGIKLIFEKGGDDFKSLMVHREKLQKVLDEYPLFHTGYFAMASLWLQLQRFDTALQLLNTYHKLDPTNPTVEYYLTVVNIQRYNYPLAWYHFDLTKELLNKRNHPSKHIKELENQLQVISPRS